MAEILVESSVKMCHQEWVPVRTIAHRVISFLFRGIIFCMRRMVLFTAFYALLSLDSLFWVGLFLDSVLGRSFLRF